MHGAAGSKELFVFPDQAFSLLEGNVFQLHHGLADVVLAPDAEGLLKGAVDGRVSTVGALHEDWIGYRVDQCLGKFQLIGEGLLGALLLRDVDQDADEPADDAAR